MVLAVGSGRPASVKAGRPFLLLKLPGKGYLSSAFPEL